MDVLRTERVLVQVVLGRDGITVLLYAALLAGQRVEHGTTATSPSEGTDAQTLDRHYPCTGDDVLAVIHIFLVDAFTIVDTYLIMEQPAPVGIGEEVTRNLDTDVTAT